MPRPPMTSVATASLGRKAKGSVFTIWREAIRVARRADREIGRNDCGTATASTIASIAVTTSVATYLSASLDAADLRTHEKDSAVARTFAVRIRILARFKV